MAHVFDALSSPDLALAAKYAEIARLDNRKPLYSRFKRLFDVAAVLITLPLTVVLLSLLALLVRAEGGPAFYKQPRVGRNGRVFHIWKLRTMVPDADSKLDALLASDPAARAEWDETQKLRNDPRITRVGRFLRKTSLDELPQLLNVLTGEMSLVGPRPMMPNQQGLYPGIAYYALRPGLTGTWQISDRNQCSFAGRAVYDTHYFNTLSLAQDIGILYRTIFVVLQGTGF